MEPLAWPEVPECSVSRAVQAGTPDHPVLGWRATRRYQSPLAWASPREGCPVQGVEEGWLGGPGRSLTLPRSESWGLPLR